MYLYAFKVLAKIFTGTHYATKRTADSLVEQDFTLQGQAYTTNGVAVSQWFSDEKVIEKTCSCKTG